MPTQNKIDLVEHYTQKFKEAKSIFLTDFKGLNVEKTNELRRAFSAANVEYRVVKNSLAMRSFHNAGIKELDVYLKGTTSFAFSNQDPVAPIKVIKDFTRKNKDSKFQVKGCLFEGKVFTAEQADAIANLPTRDVLIANFLSILQAPMAKLLAVLNAPAQKFVGSLESLKGQKSD